MPNHVTERQREAIELYRELGSQGAVAAAMGVTKATVHHLIRRGAVALARAAAPAPLAGPIDPAREALIPLSQVPALPYAPPGRHRNRVGSDTVQSWATAGLRGVRLETVGAGRGRCTTERALLEFFARTGAGSDANARPPATYHVPPEGAGAMTIEPGEKLIPLGEVPDLAFMPKGQRGADRVHPHTVRRWATQGLCGIKLEVVRVGQRRWCTTAPAVRRFLERISSVADGRCAGASNTPSGGHGNDDRRGDRITHSAS